MFVLIIAALTMLSEKAGKKGKIMMIYKETHQKNVNHAGVKSVNLTATWLR